MNRFKSLKIGVIFALAFSFVGVETHANPRLFSIAEKVFESYRLDVSPNSMELQSTAGNAKIFVIRVKARRNNFDLATMLGFMAAGTAVERSNTQNITGVRVIVEVPYKETLFVEASSPITAVKQLVGGQVRPEEFMRKHVIFT